MSDTPIDRDLTEKSSTRTPVFLADRVEKFRTAYNERIDSLDIPTELKSSFLLESKSEARRRLIDIGLAHSSQDEIPFGFAFDESTTDAEFSTLVCEECGENELSNFRNGASVTRIDGDEHVRFDKIRCLSCGWEKRFGETTTDSFSWE